MGILEGEAESIKSCEADNVYSFNTDGTASLNFGSDTAEGDCWLDGLTLATEFTYDDENGTLTIAQEYFQPEADLLKNQITHAHFSHVTRETAVVAENSFRAGIEVDTHDRTSPITNSESGTSIVRMIVHSASKASRSAGFNRRDSRRTSSSIVSVPGRSFLVVLLKSSTILASLYRGD